MNLFSYIPQWVWEYMGYPSESDIPINTFKDHIEFNYPELLDNLNTIEEYRKIRTLIEEWGPECFFETETHEGISIFAEDHVNIKTEETIGNCLKFTFFDNIEPPDGDYQNVIPEHLRTKFAIAINQAQYGGTGPNESWKTAKTMEKGSMSMFHQFLIVRDTEASLFNALTFGLNDNKEVYEMLCDMELIANLWAEKNGIPQEHLGCYFHVYPGNSIHSLHMHMVDTRAESIGKAWEVNSHKNLPLHDLQTYFKVQN